MANEQIETVCDRCEQNVSYSAEDAGTVQECPKCGEYVDVPEEYTLQAMEYNRQMEVTNKQQLAGERQLEIAERQQEHFQRQLDRRDHLDDRYELLLEAAGRLVEKWNGLAGQFQVILDELEKKLNN